MPDEIPPLPAKRPVALAPVGDATWPTSMATMRDGFAGKLNVYRTMAHHPALLAAWAGLRQHVVIDSALAADLREIAILRVGHRSAARYEIGQHLVRGRAAGLDDARIVRCFAAAPASPQDKDGLVIAAVDALLDDAALPQVLLADLRAALGLAAVFDLMATVGMYQTLAYVANSFGTPLEPEITTALGIAPDA